MSLNNSKNTPRSLIVSYATIMGNIKQENYSFPTYEGGDRVSYRDCHRGGYGLIQWTSINRYEGQKSLL